MKGKRIRNRSFFTCPAEELAPKLLGKILCRKEADGSVIRCRIHVTEAYCSDDPVNDGVRAEKNGKSTAQRLEGGHLHVKPFLGRFRFDIVAGKSGVCESVLIRGLDPYPEGPILAAGALKISRELDGADLLDPNSMIWLEDDGALVIPNPPTGRVLGETAPEESKGRLQRFSVRRIDFESL